MMDNFKVLDNVPPKIYYVTDFISSVEEEDILKNVYSSPKPKWTCLSNRKLQNWGGIPHLKGMIAEEIPKWLTFYMDKLNEIVFPKDKPTNHVLVNEYLPGQGIMPHLDGPLFFPTICTITCGSHTVLNFHPKIDPCGTSNTPAVVSSVLLERRSLVIIQEDMFQLYPHSIEETTSDLITNHISNLPYCSRSYQVGESLERSTRISLTLRHVPKTSKFKLSLGKKK